MRAGEFRKGSESCLGFPLPAQEGGTLPLILAGCGRILHTYYIYTRMEHLALEIFSADGTASQWAWLPDDAAVTITDTSELFAKGDVWSHSFTLNVNANAHIFGTSGELHGSRLHDQIDRRRARLWVEGMPLFLGYLRLGDEAEVDGDGDVDVTFESGKRTFDDLVEGAKANQVPLMDEVRFGVALWRKRYVNAGLVISVAAKLRNGATTRPMVLYHTCQPNIIKGDVADNVTVFTADGEDDNVSIQEYPRMVFPKGELTSLTAGKSGSFNCLNVDHPYDENPDDGQPLYPYCNVALCYQKQGYDKKYDNGEIRPDYSSEPEAERGYEEMPANRVNSAPNFYVIYWLRCLMKHLGIYVEENQMMDVQDLRRLFMVNTKCAYKEPKKVRGTRTEDFDKKVGRYKFPDGSDGSPKRLVPEQFGPHDDDRWQTRQTLIKVEDCGFEVKNWNRTIQWKYPGRTIDIAGFIATTSVVAGLHDKQKEDYIDRNNYLHDAIATSECFPDVDISEVVKALEDGFGIRFLFSDDYQRVRIVLLRNLFRGTDVQDIACDVVSDVKVENNIRGFRMTYGDSEDTHFYYKGFADMLPHKKSIWPDDSDTHDYSQWDLKANYKNLLNRISAFDKTCYVTENNGNAWGIKVDKNAKRYEDLHPSLFEYAGFMDAEDGDCSGDDETIEEITVGFKPAIMNDVNWEEERSSGTEKQRFALFVDEKMRPRRPDLAEEKTNFNNPDAYYDVENGLYGKDGDGRYVYSNMMADNGVVKPGEFAITSDMYATAKNLYAEVTDVGFSGAIGTVTGIEIEGHANEGYRLYLQDNFEPNDSGVSPIETHDWGLTLGIMRGSGSDAGVAYEPDPDDNEGNDTWYTMSGSSITAHPDTCDSYGNIWDYNGDTSGTGGMDGRFSLKLRAEKPNPKFDPTKAESSTNKRYLEITNADLRRRGLADQFYTEYSYWVRNARIARRKVRMELAQLLALDKTKKVRVGDITGFVRKMQYSVSNKTGLGEVTLEIMYI